MDSSENMDLFKEKRKPLVKDLNQCLVCMLCGGYYIDATTIIECLHTYCRSCIVKFLQCNKFCPICDVQVHRSQPFLSLRSDPLMQRLVYKTIPGLFKNESERRNQYKKAEESISNSLFEDGEYYYAPDDLIEVCIEYMEPSRTNMEDNEKLVNLVEEYPQDQFSKRYIECSAAMQIIQIHKLIKLKFNLKQSDVVEVYYDYNTKLPDSFSLMDVAYTFSWKRDKPMRLCYQILKSEVIEVPETISNEISDELSLKEDYVTSSVMSCSSVNSTSIENGEQQNENSNLENTTKINLKRKTSVSSKKSSVESSDIIKNSEPDDYELLVKIPRISNDKQLKDIIKAETNISESKVEAVSPQQNVAPNEIKQPTVDDSINDDFVKYEQDIEEVDDDDDDDDDDDGKLRMHLSEEDTNDKTEETADLVIDTSSEFNNVIKEDLAKKLENVKKSNKYKRKSKKSKHHHHHKHHHHRHHERKKTAPQATILHSPDSDIMKLKLKLNNVKSDTKYHKQSRRKRKKSPESYFSLSYSSSSCTSSVSGSSPDARNVSKVDDDSLHSHISEISTESIDTNSSKEEPNSTTSNDTPTPPCKITATVDIPEKYRSPTSKEKLLQMRAFRPKNIAVVKPEEPFVENKEKVTETKLDKPINHKNDNNNNDSPLICVDPKDTINKEKMIKTIPVTPILRPPSSITVSKITAAEKLKMEQEKLMLMNGSDDKPSLEIMLVNGPPTFTKPSSPVSSTTFSDSKSNKTSARQIRPPPAAIPLLQYQKMKSNETVGKMLPVSPITIKAQKLIKPNSDVNVKKIFPVKADGMKRSVTVSLSGNPFENNLPAGVLDLSGSKQTKNSPMMNVAHTLLNKKICMNGAAIRPTTNVYPSMKNTATLSAENARTLHKITGQLPRIYHASPNLSPKTVLKPSYQQQNSSKMYFVGPMVSGINKVNGKTSNIPNLNEIKIGPVSSTSETAPPKPGPNQAVRTIPNPSFLLQRHHQAGINNVSSSNDISVKISSSGDNVLQHRGMSNTCPLNNLKKNTEKCPSIPLKSFSDTKGIMVSK